MSDFDKFVKALEEAGPRQPYENAPDRNKNVTVAMLKEMLKDLPDDYEVSYDSALGRVVKGDFTIYDKTKKISING